MPSEQHGRRTCQNCRHEFEPEEEWIELCYDCRVKEIRKKRREGPDL